MLKDNLAEENILIVDFEPIKFELYVGSVLQVSANERSLMHFEWKRNRGGAAVESAAHQKLEEDRHAGKEVVDYGEDGLAIYADGTREEKVAVESVEADHNTEHRDEVLPCFYYISYLMVLLLYDVCKFDSLIDHYFAGLGGIFRGSPRLEASRTHVGRYGLLLPIRPACVWYS